MKIGNDFNTFFGSDCWVGTTPFREGFMRLFDLSVNKDTMVAEMYSLVWEEGGAACE